MNTVQTIGLGAFVLGIGFFIFSPFLLILPGIILGFLFTFLGAAIVFLSVLFERLDDVQEDRKNFSKREGLK